MANVHMTQEFNAPIEVIFDYLSDHNNFGQLLGANITRIKDSSGENPNGLGSVRSIKLGVELLQETIVTFDAPRVIEYKISNNVPVNYHLGRLEFTSLGDTKTLLNYSIELESKFSFLDPLLLFGIESTIKRGLKKLAASYS